VKTKDGEAVVHTNTFVNAAGPGQKKVSKLVGVELPVHAELHMKVTIDDHLRVVPRDMPLTVWIDPIHLAWTEEEQTFLADDEVSRWLLEEQPPISVARPEGAGDSTVLLMQWEVRHQPETPIFPLPIDPQFPEYVLRGVAHMLPGLKAYFDNLPKPYVDGGYYIGTWENRPIIGSLGEIEGAYIIGALSGIGMQISPAAGELLADHIVGASLPDYAPAFLLDRFNDPDYLKLMEEWGLTWNL
ncbi:MAG: FAD-binding oxidoreductase, partial [Chloroflexota bacterium]